MPPACSPIVGRIGAGNPARPACDPARPACDPVFPACSPTWREQVVPAYYELLRAPSEQQAQARRYPLLQALSELENILLTRQGFGDDAAESPFLCDDFSLAEVRSGLQPCCNPMQQRLQRDV